MIERSMVSIEVSSFHVLWVIKTRLKNSWVCAVAVGLQIR